MPYTINSQLKTHNSRLLLVMKRLPREFHHFVCVSPGVKPIVQYKRGKVVEQMGWRGGKIVDGRIVENKIHPFAHHFLLWICLPETVKCLAPLDCQVSGATYRFVHLNWFWRDIRLDILNIMCRHWHFLSISLDHEACLSWFQEVREWRSCRSILPTNDIRDNCSCKPRIGCT